MNSPGGLDLLIKTNKATCFQFANSPIREVVFPSILSFSLSIERPHYTQPETSPPSGLLFAPGKPFLCFPVACKR